MPSSIMPSIPKLEEHEDSRERAKDKLKKIVDSKSNKTVSCAGETKIFTWDEVNQHKSVDDCWMVIKGKVYDVTSWVPKHPGGNLIMNGAGRDATALFLSYHPTSTQMVLPKYHIGDIEDYNPFYTWDSEFYSILKKRVEEVQRTHRLHVSSKTIIFKTILLAMFWGLSYYYLLSSGYFIAAIILGIFHGMVGIQVSHDGNHGAYSKNPIICKLAGYSMDLIGASSITWEMQHNIGHHPNSNRKGDFHSEDYDPDSISGYPYIRITPNHPLQPHHRYQHIYVWFLYLLVGLKWFYGDLRSLYHKKYQVFEYWNIPTSRVLYNLATKCFFLYYALYIPSTHFGFGKGLALFLTFLSSQSYVFILMFSVNHLTEEVVFPNNEYKKEESKKERDWAKLQILTSCNYAPSSTFWFWVSGGLNFQIEHHLFPAICHMYLPYISPVVKQTCEEFGLPYHCYPDYWTAFKSFFSHLKTLGREEGEN